MVGLTLQQASCLEYEYLGSKVTGELCISFTVEGHRGIENLARATGEHTTRTTPPTVLAGLVPTFGGAGGVHSPLSRRCAASDRCGNDRQWRGNTGLGI